MPGPPASPRPFRFGLSLAGFDHGHDWAETAARVEDLGYATILVPDHLGDQLAPLPALAAAAAGTTLRVGTFVLNQDLHHPVVLAKEAATLDLLSAGRLELGLGAGWRAEEYRRAGITFHPPGVRVARLSEAVAVLKGLWSGRPFSFTGDHYRITQLEGRPLPHQHPHPPLLLAGAGPRLLALAGREADVVGIAPRAGASGHDLVDTAPASVAAKVALVREAAGPRADAVELNVLNVAVQVTDGHDRTARPDRAAELARRAGLPPEQILASPHVLLGSVDQVVDDLESHRERFGISYITVPEPALESFAPVVARLAGA